MVVDLELSVALDERKSLVFRPFWQISARFGGTVAALKATRSSPPVPMSAEFSIVYTREPALMALPSSDLLVFRHLRRRWPPERAGRWLRPDARSTSLFESGGAAFGP
jgi:hypothetical protein